MTKMYEKDLRDAALNRAIESIRAVKVEGESGYTILITLTWKQGENVLLNQLHKPRIWKSIDRFLEHISSYYQNPDDVVVKILPTISKGDITHVVSSENEGGFS